MGRWALLEVDILAKGRGDMACDGREPRDGGRCHCAVELPYVRYMYLKAWR